MPDIDSLSIRINSSSKEAIDKINDVIRALGSLNAALNNYAEDTPYVRGMNALVGGLKGIGSAINSINITKIKDVASSLRVLGNAGEKISSLNFVKTFSDMGAEVQHVNSVVKQTADEWAKEFNIPKNEVASLTSLVEKLYSSQDPRAFDDTGRAIERMVRQYAKADEMAADLIEQNKRVRADLSNTNILISDTVRRNMGDNSKHVIGSIGIRNTTSDMQRGTDPVQAAAEMGILADNSYEATQKLNELGASVSDAANKQLIAQRASYNFGMALDDLKSKIFGVIEAEELSDNEFATVDPSVMFDEYGLPIIEETREKIQNLTSAVTEMKSEMVTEVGNPFEGLITGLESLQEINIDPDKFAGIASLAASLGKFGGKNATNAVVMIPQVGRAFSQMAAELAKAPAVSENLIRLAEAMGKYSKSASTASTATTRFNTSTKGLGRSLSGLHIPTTRAHRSFLGLAAIFGHLYANFFLLIRAARLLGKAMNYSSSMTEAQNVVSVVFGKSSDVMDDFAQTAIKDFGLARLSAVEFASRFQAMGKTMGITSEQVVKANDFIKDKISGNVRAYEDLGDSVADVSINLTKLTADIASLYNQDYEDVAKDMQAIYTGMTRPLRKYGLDLTNATLKEWAMSQGLESNIEKMTQAEKTMLRYQYVMSRAAGAMGDFQKTQDTWANSLRTIKQLLQEVARMIGEAFINALRPALLAFKQFMFNFLELTEKALNALGKLMGWHQIDFGGASLVEDTEDYADALDDAAGAAKKLKGQLRGIDELNNLTTNKGAGGGAGDGSSLGAGIDSIWDQILDTPRNYISDVGTWKEFGHRIANAMKEGLSSIDWDKIYNDAGVFGILSASFLNGLIDPEAFELFGKTLAGGVMTAITAAFTFGKEFDFENLGTAISEGINGFFEEFDGGKLAETLNIWTEGLKKTIKTAAEKINWSEIFVDLFDFFDKLNITNIGVVVGAGAVVTGLPGLMAFIAREAVKHPLTLAGLTVSVVGGFKIGNWLGDQWEEALGNNPETGESYWYEYWEKVFETSKDVFPKVFKLSEILGSIFSLNTFNPSSSFNISTKAFEFAKGVKKDWDDNVGPILEELKSEWKEWIDLPELEAKLGTLSGSFLSLTENIAPFVANLTAFVDPANVTGIENINGAFGDTDSIVGTLSNNMTSLKDKFDEFKTNTAQTLEDWYNNEVAPKFDLPTWDTMVSSVKTSIENVWKDTVKWWKENISKWWTDNVAPWFTLEKWTGIVNNIKISITNVFNNMKTWWSDNISSWWDNNVAPWFTLEKWSELVSSIYDSITEKFEDTKTEVGNILSNWFTNLKNETFSKRNLDDIFGNIKNALGDAFKGGVGLGIDALNKLIEGVETMINKSFGSDGFSKIIEIAQKVTDKKLSSWSGVSLGRIAKPFADGGFPSVGSLFVAGEAGSEFVGNINGRTGVVSNSEITGITAAIRASSEAEINLLRQQNTLLQGILEKEFGISNDAIFKSVRSSARDYMNRTGNPAFS